MNAIEYLHRQMRLEGKEIVDRYLIRQVEVVPDEAIPLVLLAQLSNETFVTYIDETLPSDLQKALAQSPITFTNIRPLLDVLRGNNISFDIGHYKTYVFPLVSAKDVDVQCLSKSDSRVKAFGFDGFAEKIYAIERQGKIVCACVSTRENETCGEAWVYTDPAHRKQGLAQKVVMTWARSLITAGKVPFYSHEIENMASANLARKLGLQPVFEEISIHRT